MQSGKYDSSDVEESAGLITALEDSTPENCNEAESISPSNTTAPISKPDLRKSILAFAWPCIVELFLVSLISMVNLIMVGRLGAYAISAVGITNQPVFISIAVFQAFNIGATALVARFIGAKDNENARLVAIQALIISVISGVALCLVGYYFSHRIVVAMGAQADTVAYADLYMKYMAVGIIFQAVPTAVSALFRGAGETKSPMRFNIISNVVNVVFGFIFIYGFWFVPALGVEGAAIAATIAKAVACVMSIRAIFDTRMPIYITLKDRFRLDFKLLKRIMNIGYAAAGEQLALRVGLLIFTKIVADLGTVPFAAHQICINIMGLSFNVGQALGMAATSFMGRNLGAKKPEMAEIYGKEIRRMGMIASLFISVCFFLGGYWISALYTSDNSVIEASAFILKIIALVLPAQTSQLIIAGGLRGAGDTKWPLIATMSGILGVRVILGILFVKVFPWGLTGAWIAVAIDQFVRSIVIYFRFRDGKWKYIRV